MSFNEPWSLVEKERSYTEYLDLVDANGESLIGVSNPCREEGSNIDAHSDVLHRIAACINACRGMETSELETIVAWKSSLRDVHEADQRCFVEDYLEARGCEFSDHEDGVERAVACVNFCRQFDTDFLRTRQMVKVGQNADGELTADHPKTLADIPRFDGLVAVPMLPVQTNS